MNSISKVPSSIPIKATGRGLPDVSNLEPLCAALGISIAAFLRGEDEAPALDERTESDILDLLSAREVYRKRLHALLLLGLLGLLLGIGSVLFAYLYTMADEIRCVFIGIGLALLLIAIPLLCLYDVELGRFRCSHCHEKFRPSIRAYVLGPHAFFETLSALPPLRETRLGDLRERPGMSLSLVSRLERVTLVGDKESSA